jgi:hypothetical protein
MLKEPSSVVETKFARPWLVIPAGVFEILMLKGERRGCEDLWLMDLW